MRSRALFVVALTLIKCASSSEEQVDYGVWKWECVKEKCVKLPNNPDSDDPPLSLESCKMFCDDFGLLLPQPTGTMKIGSFLSKINLKNVEIKNVNSGRTDSLVNAAVQRFKKMISLGIPYGMKPQNSGKSVSVYLMIKEPDVKEFSIDMDESYELRVESASKDRISANITGPTFFGVRHGLETLSQLFIYDDLREHTLLTRDVEITDKPVYAYRGILLDTARNFFTVESIKATIDAMAAVKLNTFHWHITDSQSFPFESGRRPNLHKNGAYSKSKIYTKEIIRDIVRYALERGVRVLPEFDAPAHVGEGWQGTNLTVCFKAQPWQTYCVEPPCGQLNPVRDELYDYLEDIYTDMAEVFQSDMFHMGGDEVSDMCWNLSLEIQEFLEEKGWKDSHTRYLKLWNYFQTKAQQKAYKAFGKQLPLILWTSKLTEISNIEKYLKKEDYIIQVWTTGTDPTIQGLLKKGYELILSNYDALYFDCGFGAWVGSGNNWCSPYIGWHKVYDNSPAFMAQEYKDQILGGEAALWSEQVDSATMDARLWPRAAAMAERLWSEPATGWQQAEHRMLHTRERLVRMGIKAESLEPEWCYQNEGQCNR